MLAPADPFAATRPLPPRINIGIEPFIDVTHVIPYMHPAAGGPPIVVDRFCQRLAQRGRVVHVVTTDALAPAIGPDWAAPYRTRYDLDVLKTRRRGPYALAPGLVKRLRPVIMASRLVHLHTLWSFPTYAAAYLCRKFGVPYVVMPHGMLDPHSMQRKSLKKRLYGSLFEWPNLRRAAAMIYTHSDEQCLAGQSVRRLPPGFVVPLGADKPPAVPRDQLAHAFFESRPALKGRRLVVFLSRLHSKKGLDLLLPAMAILAQSHPDAHLLLVGPADPDYAPTVRQLIVQHALETRVTLTGALHGQAKWQALAAADVFALPSYQENFALVVVEALAMGLPVVLSRRVNIWRDVVDSGAALPCDLDPPSVAASIAKFFDNPDLRARATACGPRLVDQQFNWDHSVSQLEHVYAQVLATASQ